MSVFITHNQDVTIDTSGANLFTDLKATYAELVDLFGQPEIPGNHSMTIDAAWRLKFHDGQVAVVYNYKNGKAFLGAEGLDAEQITDWRVSGCTTAVFSAVEAQLALKREAAQDAEANGDQLKNANLSPLLEHLVSMMFGRDDKPTCDCGAEIHDAENAIATRMREQIINLAKVKGDEYAQYVLLGMQMKRATQQWGETIKAFEMAGVAVAALGDPERAPQAIADAKIAGMAMRSSASMIMAETSAVAAALSGMTSERLGRSGLDEILQTADRLFGEWHEAMVSIAKRVVEAHQREQGKKEE